MPLVVEEKNNDASGPGGPVPSPSLDFNDNEDIPTELSDSSETHDECNPIDLFEYIIHRNLCSHQVITDCHVVFVALYCVGEVQAFHEDLNGRQHINEIYSFSVDKLYDILFTESQFMSDFMEQRRFSGLCF